MLRLRKFMFDRVYLGPDAAARARAGRAHDARPLRPLPRAPRRAARAGTPAPSDCQRVTDYIAGMTDRYCIAKFTELTIPEEAQVLVALISPESLDRVKQAADIVEVISAHTDLRRAGRPLDRASAPSTTSARRRSRSTPQEKLYHCFGCGVGGDVIKFVEEKEGLGFAEAVELLADRYGVELEREQEDPRAEAQPPAAPPPRAAAGADRRLLRQLPLGVAGGGQGARVPGRARARRGGAARLRRRLRAQRLGQDPRRAASRPASASRSCTASAWSSAAAAAASTTASARGSCSRSATAAAAPSASAAGRCAPTRAPSTSTRPRPTSSTRARCSTASTGRKAAIAKADAGGRGRGLHRRPRPAPGRGRGDGRR